MTTGAIILAAGRSTRMGAPKMLAYLDGRPLIAHVIDAAAEAGLPPPIIVLGHEAAAIRAVLGDRAAAFVIATDFAAGMSQSLVAGLRAAPGGWEAALIMLGDMPQVAPATLAALAAAAGPAGVTVPLHNGRRGNPVAWGRAYWPRLTALTGDRGGRALLNTVEVTEVAVDDPGVFVDVDTPEALAALAG